MSFKEAALVENNQRSTIWSTGLAIFAMFFGAGNIVFPLALGQFTQDKNFYGVLGLLITAVFVPLIGLLAMLLYEGDYNAFFRRIGKIPGFFVILVILAVIGPFGGIPRCITISYSTLQTFGLHSVAGMNLITFSLASCVLIFLFAFRPNKIISLIGYVLTPILLLSLALIAVKGIFSMPQAEISDHTRWQIFSKGFLDGYKTMDLLAAFFFSSVVLLCLRPKTTHRPIYENKQMLKVAIAGGMMAAFLLALVYISFSYVAAGYSLTLDSVANHQMLGMLAHQLLGPSAGLVAGVAVSFACLTTEIALAAIFAGFLHETILKGKISYPKCVLITLFLAFLISTLHFEGISAFLAPILQISYPALIVLSILNILNKLYDFKPVKLFFYGTIALTLAIQLM